MYGKIPNSALNFNFLLYIVESRYVPVKSEIQNVRYRNVPYVAKSEMRDGGYIVKRSAENPEKKTCSPLRAMRERVLGGELFFF